MEKITAISSAILTYKCSLCDHFLSVPPIMTTGLTDEVYKCGRCEKIPHGNSTRVRLFENMAQHLSFPCSYPQCNKKITWGRVQDHEGKCRHRTIKCSYLSLPTSCSEVIAMDNISTHFAEKHPNRIKTTEMIWEVDNQVSSITLFEADNQYFLIYNLKQGKIAVLALKHSKYTKFNVKVLPFTEDKFMVIFNDLPVVRYDEKSHCFQCIMNTCDELHHPFSERNKTEEMNLNYITKLENDLFIGLGEIEGNIRYGITLVADETVEDESVEDADDANNEESTNVARNQHNTMVEALRKALSCPICMVYMSAPIYTCSVGHTICNTCRQRLTSCPTCRGYLENTRNYTLEEIAEEVRLPCQYNTMGCTFIGSATDITHHVLECPFKDDNDNLS